MSWLRDLRFRLRALLGAREMTAELDEELSFHLDMETAKLQERGLDPAEARRRAKRSLGGLDQARERTRDAWGVRAVESLAQDLRHGIRSLRRTPTVTAAALLTLALGLGASTLLFTLVERVLLRPLPYPDPDRLVQVWESHADRGNREPVPRGTFVDWRERNRVFAKLGAYMGGFGYGLTGRGDPIQVTGAQVTPSLLGLLGAHALVGRTFTASEGEPGGDDAVLLSEGLWRRRFGADPAIVGSRLTLDGSTYRIVGVLPGSFRFPSSDLDVWLPMSFPPAYRQQRKSHVLRVVGRLAPGVSRERAQAEMSSLTRTLAAEHPEDLQGWGVHLVPLRREIVGEVQTALLVLLGAVVLLLVIACVNVTSLLLARGTARTAEVAMRTALGASGRRLVRQLLTESLVLALLGGAAGFALAAWGLRLLRAWLPEDFPRLHELAIDPGAFAFAATAIVVTGLAVGVLPALRATRSDLRSSLQGGGPASGRGPSAERLRKALVVVEIALSLVLLAGAGLLVRSYVGLRGIDFGFKPQGLLAVSLNLPRSEYPDNPSHLRFYDALIDRLQALPGVESAAATSEPPVVGFGQTRSLVLEGRAAARAGDETVPYRVVTDHYFRTLGIPLLAGRGFLPTDRADTPPVLVINRSMARKYWPGSKAVGQRIAFRSDGPWYEIVGVVGDTRHDGLDRPTAPAMYAPLAQKTWSWLTWMTVMVRTGGDPSALGEAVCSAVWSLDPKLPILHLRTVEEIYSESLARRRFDTLVLALFAAFAVILGAVGLYGVTSFAVARRTREIGVRMALGARASTVGALVLRQAAGLAALGIALGAAGSLALTRFVASLLVGVRPGDPLTLAVVTVLLGAVVLVASYAPARRAARTDPVRALK